MVAVRVFGLSGSILVGTPGLAATYSATVTWQPSASSYVAGYRLYTRPLDGVYTSGMDVGLPSPAADGTLSTVISSLDTSLGYAVAVTAYASDGSESTLSNEITLPPQTTTTSPTTTSSTSSSAASTLAPTTTTATTTQAPTTTTTRPQTSAGIALVQSNAVEGSGAGSISSTFPFNNAAGNLIIAFVRMSTTSQTVAVNDSARNTYVDAIMQSQATDGHQVHIFYAKGVVGGANTVTAAFSSFNGHPWLAIYEYSGLSITNPLDQTAHAQGSSPTPTSGGTAITASANELVFGAAGLPANYTGTAAAGSGYTLQRQDSGTSRAANEAATVTSTGSYAGSFTLSSSTNWSAVVATFAAAPLTTTTTNQPATTTSSSTTATTSAPTTMTTQPSTTTTVTTSTTTSSTSTTRITTATTSTTQGAAPVNITPPLISGTAQQGQSLTTSNGTWSNNPTSYAFQWRRCKSKGMSCAAIAGATAQTYTLTAVDVGSFIRAAVTASNAAGSSTAVSSPTAAVQPAP